MSAPTAPAAEYLFQRVLGLAAAPPAPRVERRVRHILLDHLGCALMGYELTHTRPAFDTLGRLRNGTRCEATCIDGGRGPAFLTAYLNGASANALDFDDTLYGHPGAPIIAAALAAGERAGARLEDLIRAIVAGYQTHCLLSRAGWPSRDRASRVRSVSAYDVIAGAVAVVAVTGLDHARLSGAVSLACTQSVAPFVGKWYERPVPGVKNNLGWCAASAVLAADLADSGAVGITRPLDGEYGFWLMVGSDRWDWDSATNRDGDLAVMQVGFKRYPACWHLQHYLRTLESLIDDLPKHDHLQSIAISGSEDLGKFIEGSIDSTADIAFSIRTLCAMLASGIPPGPRWSQLAAVRDVEGVIPRVHATTGTERTVAITTMSGRTISKDVVVPDYDDPYSGGLDEEGIRAKFYRNTPEILAPACTEALAGQVLNGPGSTPLTELTGSLVR